MPEAARNTLLSTLMRDGDIVRIGGQYWDAIAWATGAWAYCCVTGDAAFLNIAYEAIDRVVTRALSRPGAFILGVRDLAGLLARLG